MCWVSIVYLGKLSLRSHMDLSFAPYPLSPSSSLAIEHCNAFVVVVCVQSFVVVVLDSLV